MQEREGWVRFRCGSALLNRTEDSGSGAPLAAAGCQLDQAGETTLSRALSRALSIAVGSLFFGRISGFPASQAHISRFYLDGRYAAGFSYGFRGCRGLEWGVSGQAGLWRLAPPVGSSRRTHFVALSAPVSQTKVQGEDLSSRVADNPDNPVKKYSGLVLVLEGAKVGAANGREWTRMKVGRRRLSCVALAKQGPRQAAVMEPGFLRPVGRECPAAVFDRMFRFAGAWITGFSGLEAWRTVRRDVESAVPGGRSQSAEIAGSSAGVANGEPERRCHGLSATPTRAHLSPSRLTMRPAHTPQKLTEKLSLGAIHNSACAPTVPLPLLDKSPCNTYIHSVDHQGPERKATMNELELALPVDLYVPVYWTRTKKAFVRGADGISTATLQRSVTNTRRVMGIPLSHVEFLDYQRATDRTARCKVQIRPRFPLKFHDADTSPLGRLTAKGVSVRPEFVCFDQDDRVIGSILPGIRNVEFRFNSSMCCGLFSRAKSKGLRPRQYVWEFNAAKASSMDIRLLLGFVAMLEMPDASGM